MAGFMGKPETGFPEEPDGAVALTNGVISMAWDDYSATTPETDAQPFSFVDHGETANGTDATAPHNPGAGGIGETTFTDTTVDCAGGAGFTLGKFQSHDKLIAPDTSSIWFQSFWMKMTGTNVRIYVAGLKLWNLFQTGANPPTSILEVFPTNFSTGAGPFALGWVFQVSGVESTSDMGVTDHVIVADTWYRVSTEINHTTKAHIINIDSEPQTEVTNPLTMSTPDYWEWDWVYGGGPCQSSGQDWKMRHDGLYSSVKAI